MTKGPLVGPFFILEGRDQEGNLVQQNALAFWTHEVCPEGVRIDPREIRIHPTSATKQEMGPNMVPIFVRIAHSAKRETLPFRRDLWFVAIPRLALHQPADVIHFRGINRSAIKVCLPSAAFADYMSRHWYSFRQCRVKGNTKAAAIS